jgi:MFS family permease
VIVLGIVALSLALCPPVDYDSLSYHVRVPLQWLQHGTVYAPPDNYHAAFIGALQCLYLPLLAIGAVSGPQVLNFGLTLLAGLGVFALGKKVAGTRVGSIAALVFFASPLVLVSGTQPMVDAPLVLVLVAAMLALLSPSQGFRGPYLAAALLGVGFGIKYLGLIYALALAPVFLVVVLRKTGGVWRIALGVTSRAIFIAGLAASPWLVKNVLMFGNPVFPYFSAPRVEPWLHSLYPDLRPTGVDTALYSVHKQMRKAVTPARLFLHPEQLEADVDRHDSAPYLPLILAPLALLLPERRKVALVLLPALAYVGLVLAYSRYSSIRYLLPMLPGLSVALAMLYVAATRRLSRVTRLVAAATMVAMALPVPLALITRIRWKQAIPHVIGLVSDRAVLDGYWDTSDYMDVVRWTDSHVPPGTPVVLLFEGRGFYFRSTVYEDILLRNWAYLSRFADDPGCLAVTGARYIILNNDGRRYFVSRGARPEALQWDKFAGFKDRCLDLKYQNAKFEVFQLKQRERPTS